MKQNIKLWESYVRNSDVDNTVVWTVLAQISAGNWSYKVPATTNNVYELFAKSQILVNTDILDIIKTSDRPYKALAAHVKHTESVINQIGTSTEGLTILARNHLIQSKDCLAEKKLGDRKFFEGANNSNSVLSEQWLAQSLEKAPCYITNRIQANAYAYLAEKVKTHAWLLAARRKLINDNQEILVQNTSYLEWDFLEKLLSLKRQLAVVNSVPYSTFDSVFRFDYLSDDYDLPRFWWVLYEKGKNPTFQNPKYKLEQFKWWS